MTNPSLSEYLQRLTDIASMAKCTIESHASMKADDEAWANMDPIGVQEAGDEYSLEMRNCLKCGSTLCRRIYVVLPRALPLSENSPV